MDKYVQVSSSPFSPKKNSLEPGRPTANFHPSVWGNYFLKYSSDHTQTDAFTEEQHKQLKAEVRKKLLKGCDEPLEQQLTLIDTIQQLGIAYHFESEIDVLLNNQLLKFNDPSDNYTNGDDDLYIISLRFRLLRQHGHRVSTDIFDKFKANERSFKEFLKTDVRGLLSLYESANMRIHNENVLDEALDFSTTHLKEMVYSLNIDQVTAAQVLHTLNQPIRKSLIRLEARRHFIPAYQQDYSHDETLLNFAKLDFNMLQKIHQIELSEITRWWEDLSIGEKLPYARDRLVESYFWLLGVCFEPEYCVERRILTKVIVMTSIIDDTFDAYGTFEELTLFTNAVSRWDADATNELPEYMQHIYIKLLEVYTEMEQELSKEASYRVEYAKKEMKQLVKVYLDEAIWYHEGYVPTMDEYMKVTTISCGFMMCVTTSFVVMGVSVPEKAFDWVSGFSLIIKASSVIIRLRNDLASHELEQKRGHVASAIECYMKEYCASKENALVELNKRITDAWKDINQECLGPTVLPLDLQERVLNLTRVAEFMYKDDGDWYTNTRTRIKDCITSLLIESVPI